MKKLISMFLMLMLACALSVTANAAKFDVSTSANMIAPGESVMVTVALEEEIPADLGATVLQGIVSFNGEILELKNIQNISTDLSAAEKHASEDKVIFHYLSMDSTAKAFAKGTLVELTFQAKQEISGDHIICDIRFHVVAQNAKGENVGDLETSEKVALMVGSAHIWDEGTITKAPTCVEGEKTVHCTVEGCGATKTEPVAATGEHKWKEATCTVPKTCENCGVTDGERLGHGETEIRDVQDATYTETGYTGDTYCVSCGEKLKSGKSISPKGLPKPVVTVSYSSKGKPVLEWTDYSEAKSYYIYRATSKSGKYTKIDSTTAGTYTDSSAVLGKTYYYKVKAIASNSKYNSVDSTYDKAYCKCAAPTVSVSVSTTTGKPTVKWKKITGAKAYRVYRATSKSGTYKLLKTTTSTSYTDTSAKAGTTYYYKVQTDATKGSSYDSIYSSVKSGKCICAKPVVKVKLSSKKPKLTWKKVSGATKYTVYRSTKSGSGYKIIKTTSTLSFRDTTAKKGTTYYYKVVAVNSKTSSVYSAYAKIKSK